MTRTSEIEYAPVSEIKKYQEKRLAEALDYLAARSPFYKRMFEREHIDVTKIRKIEDLSYIPLTEKADLQRYNSDFFCVPKRDFIDYITTSGTLSDPVTFAMTERDLQRLAYNEKLSFMTAGVGPDDIVQLMTTIDKRFMAGLAYFLGIRMLGAGIIRVGNGNPELQWDTIKRVRPNAIMCVPSFIPKVIDYAESHGIDYRNSPIRKAVCIGENLREMDMTPNLLARRIKEKWDIDLYATYASTEMATTFAECEYGCGGHHHPELIICELTDDKGNVVPEGEVGEMTVTTLGVEGMPLLRFKTGDMCRFDTAPCKCGRTTMRVSPILGRKNHMIKFKGTTVYPPMIVDVLDNCREIDNYQLILDTNEIGTDDVLVKVGVREIAPEKVNELVNGLKNSFRAKIRVAPRVEVCRSEELSRRIFVESSRKPVKIVDLRGRK